MNFIRLFPVVLSSLLMAAHSSRANQHGLMIVCLLLPFLLFIKRRWVAKGVQVLLLLGCIEWIHSTLRIIHIRKIQREAWTRLVIILGSNKNFWCLIFNEIYSIFLRPFLLEKLGRFYSG